ncbi:hypothetical protein [Erythrobacter sp.]|uniref:hypothetical protein n=1 Tax=Erythrobacter sp. TaxID=1042 RepID=UPI001425D4F7|nr:hypothetical protein [Erythrobacter sp.]QIQ87707.1 MAG: hypothetical protein G9473_14195 [Erythrobacter sp.]
MKETPHPEGTGCKAHERVHPRWRDLFIAHLEQSSSVARSAERAGVSKARVYRARRNEPGFANAWALALERGYEDLEMEMLRRLREGDLLAREGTKYEFAAAIRLLALHRDDAARSQAGRREVTAAEIRASIDRKIADIRQRIAEDAAEPEPDR